MVIDEHQFSWLKHLSFADLFTVIIWATLLLSLDYATIQYSSLDGLEQDTLRLLNEADAAVPSQDRSLGNRRFVSPSKSRINWGFTWIISPYSSGGPMAPLNYDWFLCPACGED